MQIKELDVLLRTELGKNKVNKLKAEGLIPSIIYGENEEPLPITVNLRELNKVYKAGKNVIIKLNVKGGEKVTEQTVISHQIEIDRIKQRIIHVDFVRINLEKPIEMSVPIKFTGISIGAKLGGILIHNMDKLDIKCLPHLIPDHIEIDITTLEAGKSIKVKDLRVSEGLQILTGDEETVVNVAAQKEAEAEVAT